jgi:manganese transport protein
MIVIALGLDPTHTLVISQVILSFGLPFALIPLVLFSQRRAVMGELVNRKLTSIGGWAVTGLVVTLNLFLLFQVIS